MVMAFLAGWLHFCFSIGCSRSVTTSDCDVSDGCSDPRACP